MHSSKYIFCVFAMFLLPLFTGCGFMGAVYQKETDEEKRIIGNLQKNNPRITEIQRLLEKAGFDKGFSIGAMDSKTRAAIRKFQKANELKATGIIDSSTWAKLVTYILMENASSVLLKPQNTFKEYLIRGGETISMGKEAIQDEVIGHRLKSLERIKNAQKALIIAGFDPGPIDGKMGTKTKKTLSDFQIKHGLTSDGVIGPKTQEALDRYLFNFKQDIK
jgi:peptidoglycan hydrolase-like protein with peptidoglycan-binding domain